VDDHVIAGKTCSGQRQSIFSPAFLSPSGEISPSAVAVASAVSKQTGIAFESSYSFDSSRLVKGAAVSEWASTDAQTTRLTMCQITGSSRVRSAMDA
jgi:chitodextrinase